MTFLAILFGLLSAFSLQYILKDSEAYEIWAESKSNSLSQDQKKYLHSKIRPTVKLMYSLRELIRAIIALIYITALIIFIVIYLDLSYLGFQFYPNNYFLLEDEIKIEIIELIASSLVTLVIIITIPIILYRNTSLSKKTFLSDIYKIWIKEVVYNMEKNNK